MGNMGSPGIIDILYPGLESHGIQAKLRQQGKGAHNQETFPRKMAKFRLWKNVEGHDRGPGKVMEF